MIKVLFFYSVIHLVHTYSYELFRRQNHYVYNLLYTASLEINFNNNIRIETYQKLSFSTWL